MHRGGRGRGHAARVGLGFAAPGPPITAFNADGWTAHYPSPPAGPALLQAFSIARQGYDGAGAAVTRTDAAVITYRKRRAWQSGDGASQPPLTADVAALSTWICSDDAAPGVTNASTLVSPPPVANWTMAHRATVLNALTLSLVAFHWAARAGKQVACVKFLVTDGVTTLNQVIGATTGTSEPLTGLTVEEYVHTFDISSLSDGLITANAEIYPWVGAEAQGAVAKSADVTLQRGFSPRYFRKDAVRAVGGSLGPPTARVTTTGDDASGTWGTAASPGLPFATPQAALNNAATAGRSISAAGYATSDLDGAQVLLGPGAFGLVSATTTRPQKISAVTFRRDPATTTTKADATLTFASYRARLGVTGMTVPTNNGAVAFEDITLQRSASGAFGGESTSLLEVFVTNCTFDNNSMAAAWATSSQPSGAYYRGVEFLNLTRGGPMQAQTALAEACEHRLFRGCTGDLLGETVSTSNIEGWLVVGSTWQQAAVHWNARSPNGSIVAFNKFLRCQSTTWAPSMTGLTLLEQVVLAGNLIEPTHALNTSPGLRVSSDGATFDTNHVLIVNNTALGAEGLGRANLFYCDKGTTGEVRFHTFFCVKGNVMPGMYVKGDEFVANNNNGSPDPASAPDFIGHLPFVYGVNCAGNAQQWQTTDNSMGASQGFIYQGAGTVRPAPGVFTILDLQFASYQASTFTPPSTFGTGAGGGDYHFGGTSPAAGIQPEAVLGLALDGGARGTTNDDAGCYRAS